MLYDTHCHINDPSFNDDLDLVVKRCKDDNISLICVGCNNIENESALAIHQQYGFSYAVGIHPENVDDKLNIENFFLSMDKPIAVGEVGLDYYWRCDNKEKQKEVFKKQIELSIKYNVPLIVHAREAMCDTYTILKEYQGKIWGVMHGFSGSLEMAKAFISLGFYIGLGGVLTFKNAKNVKEVAYNIPLDKIVIETDSPYLTPIPFRGKRNEPSYVRYVFNYLVELRGIDQNNLEKILEDNTKKLFRI